MSSKKLPVVLLIGAKSSKTPIEGAVVEINKLESLMLQHKGNEPLFELDSLPSFTTDILRNKLSALTNRLCLLHFAGHSDDTSLVTDDPDGEGSIVYSHHIVKHINSWEVKPSFIFLNGCQNKEQVEGFHAAGVDVVIATHRAISDIQAEKFAHAFYKCLFDDPIQTDLEEAFDRATSILLLNEGEKFRSPSIESLLDSKIDTLDWGIFPRYNKQLKWTLKHLITDDRPVWDKEGKELINPYKGLEAFQEQDKQWFFGREKLIDELTKIIPGTNFYMLLGASGSGKSSLINAGVVPRLREMGNYSIQQCKPGAEPFRELATIFTGSFGPDSKVGQLSSLTEKLQSKKVDLADLY